MKFLPFLCTVFGAATVAAAQPLVDAPCGSVRGVETHGAQAFLGIPYGETTSGANRWRPPRPKRPWPGIRDCTKYGPICPQESKTSLASGGASEDCLNLNVWTPRTVSRPLPVMVWIHGGAFVSGAGSLPIYQGASLASRGVVVVTLNYRLGVLGFLAHPELTAEGQGESGNYGVLDVIEALRWVQTNIRSFGGDPARVTVFGQSAGAALIRVLLVSPVARGLFQRAILESGPAGQLPYLQRSVSYLPSAESFGSTFAERVLGPGLARTSALRRLRETPVRDLLAAMGGRQNFLDEEYAYGPVIGGWVLPADPFELMSEGKHANVPVILGSNANEGATFAGDFPRQSPSEFRAWVRSHYGVYATPLLRELGPVRSAREAERAMARLFGDERFAMLSRLGARRLSRSSSAPVYLYVFSSGRAAHGAEIPYVFGAPGTRGSDLCEAIQSAWVRFAQTGDPQGSGLSWPRYDEASDRHLELGRRVRVESGWHRATCDLLEEKFLADRGLPR